MSGGSCEAPSAKPIFGYGSFPIHVTKYLWHIAMAVGGGRTHKELRLRPHLLAPAGPASPWGPWQGHPPPSPVSLSWPSITLR